MEPKSYGQTDVVKSKTNRQTDVLSQVIIDSGLLEADSTIDLNRESVGLSNLFEHQVAPLPSRIKSQNRLAACANLNSQSLSMEIDSLDYKPECQCEQSKAKFAKLKFNHRKSSNRQYNKLNTVIKKKELEIMMLNAKIELLQDMLQKSWRCGTSN